jgi:TetR/AcrR family transcriptional repressor of nem operon
MSEVEWYRFEVDLKNAWRIRLTGLIFNYETCTQQRRYCSGWARPRIGQRFQCYRCWGYSETGKRAEGFFFSSKEEFALAIIDKFVADRAEIFSPIYNDESLPPLERIRKSFESVVALFAGDNCTKGCLIGNLSLEMSDQFEKVRQRLELSFHNWTKVLARLLLQAQNENTISLNINAEMLAENMISSFEGALLRSKVKKSSEPLKNFIHLYFDVFLGQKEEV